jgi:hypothetical protein
MARNRASDAEMADESNPTTENESSPEQEDVHMDVCFLYPFVCSRLYARP